MSFTLPDLVVEGAIRKGFDFLRLNAGSEAIPAVTSNQALVIPTATCVVNLVTQPPASGSLSSNFPLSIRLTGFSLVGTPTSSSVTIVNNATFALITITTSDTFTSTSSSPTAPTESVTGTINTIEGVTPILGGDSLNFSFRANLGGTESTDWINNVGAGFGSFETNTVNFTFTGLLGKAEDIGAGSEVLNMLFDFEVASNSKDGGIPSSVSGKYAQEPKRLIDFFRNNEVAIIQSFSDVQANLPCISIQLANDGEDQGLALTDDFGGIESFDANNGIGRDESTIHANTTINVGIHTKEQLLTKYIYHIAKYFILSAKEDLIRQNFIIATFKGSDFTRDASWQGDHVYTRFLNVSGKTEDSWVNLDEIVISLENVGVNIFVGPPSTEVSTTSSLLVQSVSIGSTFLQLGRSFYLNKPGIAEVVTYNGRGIVQTTSSITWDGSGNDELTNILTLDAPLLVEHQVILSNDPLIARTTEVILPNGTNFFVATDIDGNVIGTYPGTIQNPPSNLLQSTSKQEINDEGGVLHRSNYVIPE